MKVAKTLPSMNVPDGKRSKEEWRALWEQSLLRRGFMGLRAKDAGYVLPNSLKVEQQPLRSASFVFKTKGQEYSFFLFTCDIWLLTILFVRIQATKTGVVKF